jgi:CubicO group peptidase (beta-lactamase class C family)
VAILAAFSGTSFAQDMQGNTPSPPESIPELRQQLEKILADTHTPGLSLTIVHADGPEWIAGLGKSDVATNQAATEDTLFRIGSATKAFVSLAVLKLVDEGRLTLSDPVRKLAPEIWFENPWESTDPVRVVDLLEHTTGWNDWGPVEFGKDGENMSLREGLDFTRKSRVSRWRPGTRMSYCNSGPAVAAFIVEKLTGQRFEDYVTQNFFSPIGMKTATFFEQPKPLLTSLYDPDGKVPYAYWNILLRPAGSINASAKDMAAYLLFYLNRGAAGDRQIVPAAAVDRMETPTRSWEAQEGLKAGYGLGNYVALHDGFVYHGHQGTVIGGLTDVAYLREYGVGYFYSTNSANTTAFDEIGESIRAYITRNLTRQPVPPHGSLPANFKEYEGWYVPDAPRFELTHFLSNLLAMKHVRFVDGALSLTGLGQREQTFVPVTGGQFRSVPKTGRPDPVPSAALILRPNPEGRFFFLGGPLGGIMKRVPTTLMMLQIACTVWVLLALAAVFLYALLWIPGGLIPSRRRPAERAVRAWPLIAVLCVVTGLAIFRFAPPSGLGSLSAWSAGLSLATISFAAASGASGVALLASRKREIPALLIASVYLWYWGIIGIRSWA